MVTNLIVYSFVYYDGWVLKVVKNERGFIMYMVMELNEILIEEWIFKLFCMLVGYRCPQDETINERSDRLEGSGVRKYFVGAFYYDDGVKWQL